MSHEPFGLGPSKAFNPDSLSRLLAVVAAPHRMVGKQQQQRDQGLACGPNNSFRTDLHILREVALPTFTEIRVENCLRSPFLLLLSPLTCFLHPRKQQRGMRATRGCQACRTRHTKCIKRKDQSICTRCQEDNQECIFDSKWRFKHVAHVDTASQGVRSRTKLVYDANQPWVSGRKIAKFVLESGDAMDIDVLEAFESQNHDGNADEQGALGECDMSILATQVDNGANFSARDSAVDHFVTDPISMQHSEDIFADRASTTLDFESGDRSPKSQVVCPQPLLFEQVDPSTDAVNDSLENLHPGLNSSCSLENLNSGVSPTGTLAGSRGFTACLSQHEVLLMQYFIQKLSPWVSSALWTPHNHEAKEMSNWMSAM